MDGFTVFLTVLGATVVAVAPVYGVLRFDAWREGRKW